MPKIHLSLEEATELGVIIQVEPEKILKDDSYIHSLRVPQLKAVIKWFNEKKYTGIRFSGTKADYINRISTSFYGKEPIRIMESSVHMYKSVPIQVNPQQTVKVIKTNKSLLGRDMTPDEYRLQCHLLSDPTNKNHQDPLYKMTKCLDVFTGKSGYSIQFTITTFIDPLDFVNKQLHLQLYRRDTLEPLEWPGESRLTLNGAYVEVPKSSKKSKKPGLFLTHQPILLPTDQSRISIIFTAMIWQLTTDPLFGLLQIQELPVEDLVQQICSKNTPTVLVPGLIRPHLIQCLDILGEAVKSGNVEAALVGLNGILKVEEEEMIVQSDEVVSLIDNVTLKRIEIPAKSKQCKHKACFDLKSFLLFAHTCRCWNCPLCDVISPVHTLLVDQKMVEILAHTKMEKILIRENGTFEEVKKPIKKSTLKPVLQRPIIPTDVIEID
jgi:hypothetical protein